MTRHVSFAEFRENLAKYMDEVASGGSLHIERDSASVVMISEKEFAGWRETIYLLQNAANAEDLLKAIKAADAGGLAEHALMGDAY
jgi:PHD/YefM family antitoxin component YafN of YafNO toxin-antitoxin module